MEIAMWIFPRSDFADWLTLVGKSECATYGDYRTLVAAVAADCERQGHRVSFARLTVSEMRAELARLDLPNTPNSRAAVISVRAR